MGIRFRRSIKVAPGVKLNLGKKSAGISVGNKYGGMSINSRTGARARVSAPGTGLSYSSKIGSRKTSGNSHQAIQKGTSENASCLSPSELRETAKKYQKNYKFVTIAYPIIAVLFLVVSVATPVALLVSALFIFLFFTLRKKYRLEIPQLLKTAAELDMISGNLAALEKAKSDIERTKNAALFFLNLDTILQHTKVILEKAPDLCEYSSMEECQQSLELLFGDHLEAILQSDFEKTYKHLFELKTMRGIESAIEKFSGPYQANLSKMSQPQYALYENYLEQLKTAQLQLNV